MAPDHGQLEMLLHGTLQGTMSRLAIPQAARMVGIESVETFGEALRLVATDSTCYKRFFLAKRKKRKSDPVTFRLIDAPIAHLALVQRKIHQMLRKSYHPTTICHSFIRRWSDSAGDHRGRTIATNAYAHLGIPAEDVYSVRPEDPRWRVPCSILKIDLKDAYPSITRERVFQIFQGVTGDPWTADVFMRLTTWNGSIPQGAPSSPILLNMALRDLDLLLEREFHREPFCITRYVDDITLTSTEHEEIPARVVRRLIKVISSFGFQVNPKKTESWREEDQRYFQVTGINLLPRQRQIALSRQIKNRFRLLAYHSQRVLQSLHAQERFSDGTLVDPELARQEEYARGMLGGIAAVLKMVYRGRRPGRIFSWKKSALSPEDDPTLTDPRDEEFYLWDYLTDDEIRLEEINAGVEEAFGDSRLLDISP